MNCFLFYKLRIEVSFESEILIYFETEILTCFKADSLFISILRLRFFLKLTLAVLYIKIEILIYFKTEILFYFNRVCFFKSRLVLICHYRSKFCFLSIKIFFRKWDCILFRKLDSVLVWPSWATMFIVWLSGKLVLICMQT